MEFYSSVRMKIVNGCIVIKPLRSEDLRLFQNLINEDKYSYYDCKFQTPVDVKHFKQVKTVFKTATARHLPTSCRGQCLT